MDFSPSPAPWSLEAGAGPGRECLRIGARAYPLAEIVGVEASITAEANVDGHMAALGFFMFVGTGFILPVALTLVHPRFLAGGVLFVAIGFMLLADIRQGHRLVVHRVRLHLASGETAVFASPEAAPCRALVALLEARGRRA